MKILCSNSRQLCVRWPRLESRHRDAVGNEPDFGLVIGKVSALAHGWAADDDGIGPAQHARQHRPVEEHDAGLSHNIAVVRNDRALCGMAYPIGDFTRRVREMQVSDVGAEPGCPGLFAWAD